MAEPEAKIEANIESNSGSRFADKFGWLVKSRHGILLLFCFSVAAFISYVIYERTIGLKDLNWTQAEGTVIARRDLASQGQITVPYIRYSYDAGELNYEKSYFNQFDGFAYKKGDKLKVLFNPENTDQSRLDLGFSLDVLALALLDLVFIAGVLYAISKRLKELNHQPHEGYRDFEPYYEIESKN